MNRLPILIMLLAALAASALSSPAPLPAGADASKRIETYLAGSRLLDGGENDRAAAFFESNLLAAPASIELCEGLIEARARSCAAESALAFLDRLAPADEASAKILGLFRLAAERRLDRDFAKAAVYFRNASSAAAREGDLLSAVLLMRARSLCLVGAQEGGEAREAAVDARRTLGGLPPVPRLEADLAAVLAETANLLDSLDAADSLYRAALSAAQPQELRQAAAFALAGLGRIADKRQENGEAARRYGEALAIERSLGSRERAAVLLNNLGQVEIRTGSMESAGRHLGEAREIADACGLRYILGYVSYGLGAIAERSGDTRDALRLFAESVRAHAAQGNAVGEAGARLRLGHLYSVSGEYARAVEQLESARAVFQEKKNSYGLGWALGGLALARHKLGDFPQAEELYRQTIEIRRSLGDRKGMAWAMNSLGMVYDIQGRYREAFAIEDEARRIYEEIGDSLGIGETDFSIGSVWFYLGNYREAMARYERAHAIASSRGDDALLQRAASGMGSVYSAAGRFDLAADFYGRCIAAARRAGNHANLVWALDNLASLHVEAGEPQRARPLLDEALAGLREGELDYLRARSLFLLGESLPPGEEAAANLERALALAESSGLRELEWRCLSDLGEIALARGDTTKSYSYQHRAIVAVESLRRLAGSDELRRHFLQPAILPYERMVELLVEMPGGAPSLLEAFGYTERCRAQILSSLLREAMARIGTRAEERILGRERGLLSKLAFYQGRLQDAALPSDKRREYLERIDSLERRFVSVMVRMDAKTPDYAAMLYPRIEDPESLLAVLGPRERLLSYFFGERRSYLFSARSKALRVYELPPRREIEERLGFFLDLLRQSAAAGDSAGGASSDLPPQILSAASRELYDLLIAPAASEFREGESLIIVPDGLLHRLPFALLKSGGTYLVEEHALSVAPSLRTLRSLRDRAALRSRSNRRPRYNLIAIGAGGAGAGAGGGRVYPFTDIPIEELPAAGEEARSVAGLFRRSIAFTGAGAAELAVKRSPLDEARMLHFAAHCYVDNDDVRRSFLVLNPPAAYDSLPAAGEDGILQWHEIAGLRLGASLVTLSSCRSAGGMLAYGEGITGLTQAFLYAGASCVVAAQTDIPDRDAAGLMIDFHRNVKRGLGAAAALQLAQVRALRSPGGRIDPAVWGSFVAVGDGAAKPGATRVPPRVVLAFVLLAVGLWLGAILVFRR